MKEATCRECGKGVPQKSGRGRAARYCSDECRRRRDTAARSKLGFKKRLTCAACGVAIWKGGGSRPQGEAKCSACYREERKAQASPKRSHLCIDCSSPSYGERCRPCANKAGVHARARIRSDDDRRVTRRQREQAAPGLTAHERAALLAEWKRKAKRCTYCPSPAATVDHVLPLVRGGTNREGNLTPCCKSCNSSKGGLTVAEWRTGRRLPPMVNPPEWAAVVVKPKPAPKPARTVQLELRPCPGCGALGLRKRCGDPECFRIEMRNQYRRRVGIPLDAPLYSRAAVLSEGSSTTPAVVLAISPQQIVGTPDA